MKARRLEALLSAFFYDESRFTRLRVRFSSWRIRFPFSDSVIIPLEIAASAVKFFGAGENVAFPLKMNFDCESDLTKRGHTKKNIYFHFLGVFWWRRPPGFNQFHWSPSIWKNGIPRLWWMTTANTKSLVWESSSFSLYSRFFFLLLLLLLTGSFLPTKRKEKSATRLLLSKKGAVCVKAHGLNRADWMRVDGFD